VGGREAEHIVICTGESSLKGKNTRRDPRVALSIVDCGNPYEEVQIRGRVIVRSPDPDLKIMDPISHKYTERPFPFRNPEGRVALIIEVERDRHTIGIGGVVAHSPLPHHPAGGSAPGGSADQAESGHTMGGSPSSAK
jgi:hypothetical protein